MKFPLEAFVDICLILVLFILFWTLTSLDRSPRPDSIFFSGAEPFPIPAFMSIILSVPVVPFFGMKTFERTAYWT